MVTFYYCSLCGNMLETIIDSGMIPVCCGEPMEVLKPASTDGAHEKHVPVYELKDHVLTVHVGEQPHPMSDSHSIEWIAVCTDQGFYRRFLHPGDEPTATFKLACTEQPLQIYAYCNLHGLWTAK